MAPQQPPPPWDPAGPSCRKRGHEDNHTEDSTATTAKGKRARGRPRVDKDKSDDSQADRRRTQIRLAQRAYRSRKEDMIARLSQKVDELIRANTEMSNTMVALRVDAHKQGLVSAMPELGRRLDDAAERFATLAKSSQGVEESESGERDVDGVGAYPTPSASSHRLSTSTAGSVSTLLDSGGYEVITKPRASNATFAFGVSTAPASFTTPSSVVNAPSYPESMPPPPLPHYTETSYIPTPQVTTNSSDGRAVYTFPPVQTPIPIPPNMAQAAAYRLPDPNAELMLPIPRNYTYHERTFGRRLQRTSYQLAISLITMDNPPPDAYAAVFGFCLLFEEREQIRLRLQNCIDRTDQSLMNWKFPFHHLGGCGNLVPEQAFASAWLNHSGAPNAINAQPITKDTTPPNDPGLPLGNIGRPTTFRPVLRETAGPYGPFPANLEEIRENILDERQHMGIPGFEGSFFDCDEVEYYLRKKGVVLPSHQQWVTADIDLGEFPVDTGNIAQEAVLDAVLAGTELHKQPAPPPTMARSPTMSLPPDPTDSSPASVEILGRHFDGKTLEQMSNSLGVTPPQVPLRRRVIINVEKLLHEISSRSICLGRTPGVRPRDLHRAVWHSIQIED